MTRRGLVGPSDYLRRSFVPAFPRGTPRPRISFDASPLANRFYPTSRLEQSAIAQHGMHDDCEATGKGDASLLQAATLGDLHGPCFQGEGLTAPGEDRVGSFVQQFTYGAVTLFGDPACPVVSGKNPPRGLENAAVIWTIRRRLRCCSVRTRFARRWHRSSNRATDRRSDRYPRG